MNDNNMPLANKVALITGAAGAIGYGICEVLLENGCRVAASDLRPDDEPVDGRRLARGDTGLQQDLGRHPDLPQHEDQRTARWPSPALLFFGER